MIIKHKMLRETALNIPKLSIWPSASTGRWRSEAGVCHCPEPGTAPGNIVPPSQPSAVRKHPTGQGQKIPICYCTNIKTDSISKRIRTVRTPQTTQGEGLPEDRKVPFTIPLKTTSE